MKREINMDGVIFNIQKFCINDGPGIRTTVFLKGCPLHCIWCHNPESQKIDKQILFFEHKCTHCGRCKNLTVDDADFFCPNGAKEICGKTVSSDEVVTEVMKDAVFYKNSGGGVTLSGGEPLFQLEFAMEILQKCKERGLHTAIETCGFVSKESIRKIAQYTDLFLFDFKEADPARHKEYTGVDNAVILENLQLLNALKKDVILRCPIIPGCNDRQAHYDKICQLANTHRSIIGIELEPYHALGEHKYAALDKQLPQFSTLTEEQVSEIIGYIGSRTQVSVKKA